MSHENLVNVFKYRDYRQFLRDHYQHRKATEYGFSHRSFSRRAGLRSSNYLKLVIDGERNLTQEMAHRFATACGLTDRDADYFCELVAFNQARDNVERNRCYKRLTRYKQYREIHKLDEAQSSYYNSWYIPAIRELAARSDFKPEPKWIATTLHPKISPQQAKKALETLIELGLLEADEEGNLTQTQALVASGPGPLGLHIANYHRTMLKRAAEAIDTVPREEREISSLTLCVSQDVMLDLKEEIREFRRRLLQLSELNSEPERVVQINFQLFPLSEKKPEK